jgi:archaellum biogenesis ATPase FlaH
MNEIILARGEVFKKEQEIKSYEIDSKYQKISEAKKRDIQVQDFNLASLEASKGRENALRAIGRLEQDKFLIRQAIMFINPQISAIAPLCPGGIYLMGAASGTGKSTTVAAIAHGLYKQGKKTFIVSNEETAAKIYGRIACVELQVNFNDFIQDKVPDNTRRQIAHQIIQIEEFVTVADDPIGSTTIEPMEKILQEVDESGRYSCIVIDFIQRIVKSTKNPGGERTQILYNFKDSITNYAQHAKTPVVIMTQLTPLSSDDVERNFETRIKWARGIYEAAACAIEVIKIKGVDASIFYVAKGRFSKAEQSVTCKFNCGMFTYINKVELKEMKSAAQNSKLNELVQECDDEK